MNITGTLVWYYYICHREVWLMSRQINAFQDNDFLEIGRLIHDESYRREKKEIQFDNSKFDMVKSKNGELVVAEIKKSSRFQKAATMQLAFYLWKLEQKGIPAKGEIRVPKEKIRKIISLTKELKEELKETLQNIKTIIDMEKPNPPQKIKFCKNCSYNEFCWS
jgi:CRISPR-associated exonuclease Cas4